MDQLKIQKLSPATDNQKSAVAVKSKNVRIRTGIKAGDAGFDVMDISNGVLIRNRESKPAQA